MSDSLRRSDDQVQEFDNFRDLHLQLDEIVHIAREASDTIAERMRALNAVAADPSSADLLHAIIDDLEKAAWMLKSENVKI